MRGHGFRGAAEIAATLDHMAAFAHLADAVPPHLFDLYHDATLGDAEVADFLADANPSGAQGDAGAFRGAARRRAVADAAQLVLAGLARRMSAPGREARRGAGAPARCARCCRATGWWCGCARGWRGSRRRRRWAGRLGVRPRQRADRPDQPRQPATPRRGRGGPPGPGRALASLTCSTPTPRPSAGATSSSRRIWCEGTLTHAAGQRTAGRAAGTAAPAREGGLCHRLRRAPRRSGAGARPISGSRRGAPGWSCAPTGARRAGRQRGGRSMPARAGADGSPAPHRSWRAWPHGAPLGRDGAARPVGRPPPRRRRGRWRRGATRLAPCCRRGPSVRSTPPLCAPLLATPARPRCASRPGGSSCWRGRKTAFSAACRKTLPLAAVPDRPGRSAAAVRCLRRRARLPAGQRRDPAAGRARWPRVGPSLHVSGCAKGCAASALRPASPGGRDGAFDLVEDGRRGTSPQRGLRRRGDVASGVLT